MTAITARSSLLQHKGDGGTVLEYIAMNIADVFDWFARESMEAGRQATEWEQRETFLRLALLWAATAQQCRKEASKLPATSTSR